MDDKPTGTTRSVLFVDDEENVLKALKRLFLGEDFEVFTAPSGPEGLAILKQAEIPVIVSDQRMPGMSGSEFLEEARKLAPESIRIILTGYADVTAAIDAINRGGAYRYITKPWNDADLVLVIKDALDKHRLVGENRRLVELTRQQNEELKKWSAELEFSAQKHDIELTHRQKEIRQLAGRLQRSMSVIGSTLYSLVELRERNVGHHSASVAALSRAVAEKMDLTATEVEIITSAARLHDIGKIGSSDQTFFNDADGVRPEERDDYIRHPVRGQMITDAFEELRPAGLLIRHHHESYNGKGFPDGLKGDLIPLGSRIIAMADRFDRLTRKSGQNMEQTIAIMRSQFNEHFDPALLGIFAESVRDAALAAARDKDAEFEAALNDLVPGMLLTRPVRAGSGLMVLEKGSVLTAQDIDLLRRAYHLDPAKSGVFTRRNTQ